MNKSVRIETPLTSKRIFAFVFDLLAFIAGGVALYFLCLYAVINPINKYVDNQNIKKQIESEYSLDIGSGASYERYEEVLQSFYLTKYPEQIKTSINKAYGVNYSITHIYNVVVLQLPDVPTLEKHQTEFFEYKMDTSGNFLVDELAAKVDGKSGPNYERNMRDLFYNSYTSLPKMLADYNADYYNASLMVSNSELISRIIASSTSAIVFFIVIPLTRKHGSTLFEKVYLIGHVNSRNGYTIPKYKIVLQNITRWALPILGWVIFNRYSIILISILPLFIDLIVMIFSGSNHYLTEFIWRTDSAALDTSVIFSNRKEEREFEETSSDELEDKDFLDNLKNINTIDNKNEQQ